MWKKEDSKPQGVPEISTVTVNSTTAPQTAPSPSFQSAAPQADEKILAPSISQGIKIKGEVTGSEDLFVDGIVEGKLNLTNGSLTIGPNGNVKADVNAREVIVRGRIEGKVSGRDRVQLWGTGNVVGEVQTERLAIEEGAVLRGKVEAGKALGKSTETKAAATASGKSSDAISINSGTAAD